MQVRDVMTRRVMTIDADDTIASARARMSDAGIHQLVVRGKRGGVKGVIGWGDLSNIPASARIRDFMPRRLVSVAPDTLVARAAAIMRNHAIGSLPVMSGSRLVGIVTVSDMLALVEKTD